MAAVLRTLTHVRRFHLPKHVICNIMKNKLNNSHLSQKHAMSIMIRNTATVSGIDVRQLQESLVPSQAIRLTELVNNHGKVRMISVENTADKVLALENINTSDALYLLQCCGSIVMDRTAEEKMAYALRLWDTFKSRNVPMDVTFYNTLLQVYLENRQDFSPVKILEEMGNWNVMPNKITYHHLIEYYCRKGNMTDAIKALECMKREGIPLSENVFNSLIIGHSQAGDLESALNVMKVMNNAQIKLTANTYTAVMCAFAKVNDMENINSIYQSTKRNGIDFSNKHILDVAYTLVANNHGMDAAVNILSMLKPSDGFPADEINFIANLVKIKQTEIAKDLFLNLLSTIPATYHSNLVPIYINTLLLIGEPVEEIITACREIEKCTAVKNAFMVAVECSFHAKDADTCINLLKAWKTFYDSPIKEHYFWPVLAKKSENSDYNDYLKVVDTMINEFGIKPSFLTLKSFIIPNLHQHLETEAVCTTLYKYNIPRKWIHNAVLYHLLVQNDLSKSLVFVGVHPDIYQHSLVRYALRGALEFTGDVDTYRSIVRHLHSKDVPDDFKIDDVLNLFLYPKLSLVNILTDAIYCIMGVPAKQKLLEQVIRNFKQHNLPLHQRIEPQTIDYFGKNMTMELQQILSNMYNHHSKEVLQVFFDYTLDTRHNIIHYLCNNDKVEDIKQIMEIINKSKIIIKYGSYRYLCQFACAHDMVTEATAYMKVLRAAYGNRLRTDLITSYLTLLLKHNLIDDVVAACSWIGKGDFLTLMKYVLNALAKQGNCETLEICFNNLLAANKINIKGLPLSYLVKVHIARNDFEMALTTMKSIHDKYGILTAKHAIIRACIIYENLKVLQDVTEYISKVHSRDIALRDLMVNFIVCNCMKQAKNLMTSYNVPLTGKRMSLWLRQWINKQEYVYIDRYCSMTKDTMDKEERLAMYEQLLQICVLLNDWQYGLQVWRNLQKEELPPSTRLMQDFATLLKVNNQTIPSLQTDSGDNEQQSDTVNVEDKLKYKDSENTDVMLNR